MGVISAGREEGHHDAEVNEIIHNYVGNMTALPLVA
jgi:hypothetical protein